MKLARVNTALVVVIALVNLTVLVLPVLPAILFDSQIKSPKAVALRESISKPQPSIPADKKQLIIPSMALETTIFEGSKRQLNQGVWRLPHTSTPSKQSNTVLVAHRFTYTNPQATFYHLDKIKVGDPIAILWEGKKYVYRTTTTQQVKADRIDIERPTDTPQLTLYTCTPLWNPKDRLVVTAKLEEIL